MKITLKKNAAPKDLPVSEMPSYTLGIITSVPTDYAVKPGDKVYKGQKEVSFPELQLWSSCPNDERLRYRPLEPGEQVIFEAEDK